MDLTRRTLLGGAMPAPQIRAAAPNWDSLRGEFPLQKDLLYMNAANIAPAPAAVWGAHPFAWRSSVRRLQKVDSGDADAVPHHPLREDRLDPQTILRVLDVALPDIE